MSCCYYFFFQAEDGIRDATVTGVQTCALPISRRPGRRVLWPVRGRGHHARLAQAIELDDRDAEQLLELDAYAFRKVGGRRSEERRVGQACSSLCTSSHQTALITAPSPQCSPDH